MDRAFKGVWIPAEIWLNENLTVMEKVLYAEIDSFCGKDKACFCSNTHFAVLLQLKERRIRDLLKSLEGKGLIKREITYKAGTKEIEKRYIKTIPPAPYDSTPEDVDDSPTPKAMDCHTPMAIKCPTPGADSCPTPGAENCLDTSTSSSTNSMNTTIESVSNDTPSQKKTRRSKFMPPTLEEVRAYITEKKLAVDPQKFFDYYEAGEWHDASGKPVKMWKQKCITWDRHSDGKRPSSNEPQGFNDEKIDWSKYDG